MLERLKRKLFSLQVLVMLKPCINDTQTLLIREKLIDGMFLFFFFYRSGHDHDGASDIL